jgi:UDP-N-acetylmuramoyl-tripeptide--D-alanyl-D-alanine ligase
LSGPPGARVTGFATDSREVRPGDLFLAIAGERSDGHDYVARALASGAVAAVVERPVVGSHVLVENLVTALANMATALRANFAGPVIGITGSAGKTTAKELTASALCPLGNVLKNEGNRNTEFTSPLVWAELDETHRAAVIEMGMRGFGQIEHLASFSRPTIGVVTNVGVAHVELVHSREGIARAKGELLNALPQDGVAVLWQGDDFLDLLRELAPGRTTTFGFEGGADCSIQSYRVVDWGESEVAGHCFGVGWRARLPAVGRHVAISASAAVLAAVVAGVPAADAGEALVGTRFAPMRMEVIDRAGVRILLDTYNASPPSMIAALETYADLPVAGRRLAILGEMRELGDYTQEAHRQLGRALVRHPLDHVMLFGKPMAWAAEEAIQAGMSENRLQFAQTMEELRALVADARPGDAVLIKGSRSLELERALE